MKRFINCLFVTAVSLGLAHCLTACGGGSDGMWGSSVAQVTLQSISVQVAQASIPAGSDTTVQAIGHFSDGSTADITGSSSAGGAGALTSVSWSTAPASVAKFFSPQDNTLRTSLPGTVVVTARDFFSGVSGTATVNVTAPAQTMLSISGLNNNQTISARTRTPLTALVLKTDGSTSPPSSLTWTASNPSVATIDSSGNFQGVGAGSVTITAASGTFTKSISLTLLTPLTTPIFTVSCNPSQPTTINAQQWNNQLAIDSVNATEWIVVDGSSCQSYPVVELLVQSSPASIHYFVRFFAERSLASPSTFQPGTASNALTAGQTLAVGSATTISDSTFSLLYSIVAQ